MEKILIPTDFSKCADAAINFAVESAKISTVELALVHVLDFYPAYGDPYGLAAAYPAGYWEDMEKQLLNVKAQLDKKGVTHVDATLYESPFVAGVLKAIKQKHAELVVMGTNGASGMQETLWGSQTGAIIAEAAAPVLAVPCNYKWKHPQKLMLATNSFEKQAGLVEFLLEFLKFYQAELHIVVFTDKKKDKALTLVEHQHQLDSYTAMIKAHYGVSAVASHIHGNDLEHSLNEYIKDHQIDILAMVTHKRKFFEGIFHPSTTKRISYHTKIPLLAIPSKK